MGTLRIRLCCGVIASLASLTAADIAGNVVIKRRLTPKKVTAPASAYQRGAAVELGAERKGDDLGYERQHVVVYLEGAFAAEPVTAVMEQRDRRFVPDLLTVPAGSTVSFPNLDPIFHNVFSLAKPKTFDLGNYPKNHTRTVTFPKPGIVFLNCHLHPNMGAAIVVTPNQWTTRPDGEGGFRLADVPPGQYTVVAWHKTSGFFRRTVKLEADRAASVQFVIPLGEDSGANRLARR